MKTGTPSFAGAGSYSLKLCRSLTVHLVGLAGTLHGGDLQPLRHGGVAARLLPVERVGLPHAAPLHRPLENAGDHGVVRLVCVLQYLAAAKVFICVQDN